MCREKETSGVFVLCGLDEQSIVCNEKNPQRPFFDPAIASNVSRVVTFDANALAFSSASMVG